MVCAPVAYVCSVFHSCVIASACGCGVYVCLGSEMSHRHFMFVSARHNARSGRNHFVSALKLFRSGQVVGNEGDKQLKRVLGDGPLCQVLDEGLYRDSDGMPLA